jgi:thiol-disulfide isomerase/thioredoxin
MELLDTIIGFVQANPLLVFALLFFAYNKWKASQPWPDFGGRITKVHSKAEWDALLSAAGDKVVVVDAYATWCGPCRSAAPVYARLSEAFAADSCIFAKFDTDEAKDLAVALSISAMPTFKVRPGGSKHRPRAPSVAPRSRVQPSHPRAGLQGRQGGRGAAWLSGRGSAQAEASGARRQGGRRNQERLNRRTASLPTRSIVPRTWPSRAGYSKGFGFCDTCWLVRPIRVLCDLV